MKPYKVIAFGDPNDIEFCIEQYNKYCDISWKNRITRPAEWCEVKNDSGKISITATYPQHPLWFQSYYCLVAAVQCRYFTYLL